MTHDLAGDGKTIAKFSYGQYWLARGPIWASTGIPTRTSGGERYTWSDDGNGVWEPGEEGHRRESSRGGVALESLDPGLELPVLREVAAWIERELGREHCRADRPGVAR